MSPLERLALCEMASRSLPALRWPSIQFQRSPGCFESSAVNGKAGTLAQSLKKTLRCRFWFSGIAVHSYEQNAVNLPGTLAWLASSTFFFQTLPEISGDLSAGTGGPDASTLIAYNATRTISSLVFAFSTSGSASGIFATGLPGSFASWTTPAYSEWSVTPAQSSGVSIFTSKPSGCLIGSPLKYL